MNSNKYNGLTKYLVIGMITGLFIGTIFSVIIINNTFFRISSSGFGLVFGLLVADIVWCVKNT